MGRTRATSIASTRSGETTTQELGSMYDYLAKTVLLGPSGAGKSVPPTHGDLEDLEDLDNLEDLDDLDDVDY